MAKSLTPSQIAEKQVRRAQGAVQDYKDGVMGVKVSPTKTAADNVQRWFEGIQRSYNDGTYVDGLNSVTLQDWQNRTVGKGALTYAKGVADAQSTIEDFHNQRQQVQNQIDSELAGMPRGDLQQNLQRMLHQVSSMNQRFKYKKRRR